MRIVLITDDFYPNLGGISHTLTYLCKFFKDKEYKLYVFNPFISGKNIYRFPLKSSDKKINFNLLKSRKFWKVIILAIWRLLGAKQVPFSHRLKIILYLLIKPKILSYITEKSIQFEPILKKLNPDIIFGGHSGGKILPLAFLVSKLYNLKLVSFAHGNDVIIHKRLSLRTYFYRNIDKFMVHTYSLKDMMKKMHNLDDNKFSIVRTGINLEDYNLYQTKEELRNEFNIPKDIFVLLSVGRQVLRKKFDLVIRAVYEIKKRFPDLKLKYYLIGDGEATPMLKELTKQLRLQEEVIFLGECGVLKRNKFYKLSDLFLMPSAREKNSIEGFGVVYLEANYYKVPVIGSKIIGVSESVVDGETGILIKPNNLEELIQKIIFLLENEQVRKSMGEKGHQRVVEKYNWKNIINDYVDFFKNL
ncbi:MAG: glycosyltransferase family 4 protein [Candidatus Thorarchaeota archaeon]